MRDVAEADEQLRVSSSGAEIEQIGDAVGAGAASRGDDRTDLAIEESIVQIGQAVVVTAGTDRRTVARRA